MMRQNKIQLLVFLLGDADISAFLAISKKELTVTSEREKGEITEVMVEVKATDNKRELAIYEVYTAITTAADTSADPQVQEETMERTGKLRTLVYVSGLSSDDNLEFTGDNADCSQDKS